MCFIYLHLSLFFFQYLQHPDHPGLALRPAVAPPLGSGDLQRQHRRSGRRGLGEDAATAAGVDRNDAGLPG